MLSFLAFKPQYTCINMNITFIYSDVIIVQSVSAIFCKVVWTLKNLTSLSFDGRRLFKVIKSHWLFAVSTLTSSVPAALRRFMTFTFYHYYCKFFSKKLNLSYKNFFFNFDGSDFSKILGRKKYGGRN